jgi:hypothetical protein
MYEVVWTESAVDELAAIWLEAETELRPIITAAQSQVDQLLERSPTEVGESRRGNRRVTFVPPLGVVFSVRESARTVKVLRVWNIAARAK